MLAISPDNTKLCWVETGYPRGLDTFESTRREATLDDYSNTALGVVSLTTGARDSWRLAQQKHLPKGIQKGQPLPEQADAKCAFSADGKRVFITMAGLLCVDVASRQWRSVLDGPLSGLAVVLAPEQRARR